MSKLQIKRSCEKITTVQAGSEADDKWRVEVYDESIHTWLDVSDPSTYEDAVVGMKNLLSEGNLTSYLPEPPEGEFVDPEEIAEKMKHRLRVRKVGSDEFVLNDLIC